MPLDNDARGWIMTCVSGIGTLNKLEVLILSLTQCLACVFGASIICVDLIIQRIPSKRNFKIQDSDAFLSASLSLSFGVMVGLLHCFSGDSLFDFPSSFSQLYIACFPQQRIIL